MNRGRELFGFLRRSSIRRQLYTIYILAVFVPVVLIGIFLVGNTYQLLTSYHRDLLESDNLRVRTILFEITTQAYNISEELSFDEQVVSILKGRYASEEDFVEAVNTCASSVDSYMYHYTEIRISAGISSITAWMRRCWGRTGIRERHRRRASSGQR